MHRAARRTPDALFLRFEGKAWTFAQADAEIEARLTSLEGSAARVAMQSFSSPEMAWTFFACGRAGRVFVPINARLTAAEVERLPFDAPSAPGDEPPLAGLFTSGTTGVPKLIELTAANFEANAAASAELMGGDAAQRWLGTLPLFHVGGLAMLYRCAVFGASLQLERGFDAERASAALDHGVTHASFVPTMLDRVLDVRGDRPFSGVRAVLIGGGPMTTAQLQRARAAGLPVLQTYGLTEACSQVTTERLDEADGTTAGRPIPGVEIRLVDGEIEVKGPTVARGCGPWLRTKDLGVIDAQGRLRILSRRADLIVSGGENVYPAELEAVLRECPGVTDVAIAPREDAQWGQVPVAVVSGAVDDAVLVAFAKTRLAGFKIPRAWIHAAVPRNATGKIDRQKLLALTGGQNGPRQA